MYQQTSLVGNLGSAPISRQTKSDNPQSVTNFSVATSRQWVDDNGERQEFTTWFQVNAWGRLGEVCSKYLSKGDKVLVVGEMQAPRVYQDRNGNNRADLNLRARDVKFLTPRNGDAAVNDGEEEAPAK